MRRRLILLLLALASVLSVSVSLPARARAATADPPCPPGQSPDPSGLACVLVDKATTGVDAQTQPVPPSDPWLTRALKLQHHLGDALPWRDAMWVGTHNSFNTPSNTVLSPSNMDSNQHLSLVDQLAIGVRALEIDVHWMPSVWVASAKAPVVCHGRPPSEQNVGCTYERLLRGELEPVGTWLRQHPGEVVLLYLEDAIDDPGGYDAAATQIRSTVDDLVYRPQGGASCPELPLTLSRADVLAKGKQIVIMSGCEPGSALWGSIVFNDSVRAEEGNPDFTGYPTCTSDSVPRNAYGSKLVRFYEDSTFVSAAVAGGDPGHRLTVDTITDMVDCGVNLFGLDQVDPSDPRLEAMVWSWARGEPTTSASGTCAIAGRDYRFHAVPCDGPSRPFACVDGRGYWFKTYTPGHPWEGSAVCEREHPGSVFAVPGSGAHALGLTFAQSPVYVPEVWVAYAVGDHGWAGNSR